MSIADRTTTPLPGHDTANQPERFRLGRRDFLKLSGGGLLVCCADISGWSQESGRGFDPHELPKQISSWIHIGADNHITVFTGKVEVGQNIRTSLAQSVAEELMVPFDAITLVMGDTDLTPWDMGTFGSMTTPAMGPRLRSMAAAARQTLLEIAARHWKADPASLTVGEGKITSPAQNQSLTYGELTRGEKLITTVPGDIHLAAAKGWKVAGLPLPKANGKTFVNGKHQYPSDIVLPGMLYGKVLRPKGFNATLESLDSTDAEKAPGIKLIHDGDFVAVAAPDPTTAEQAIGAFKAKWSVPPQASNNTLFESLRNTLEAGHAEAAPQHVAGSVSKSLQTCDVKLSQQYTVQYIAHAPLEPRAAVAQWESGKLTVWTGTQRPFGVRDELMAAFRLPAEQVRVIQPDMGSGYGGKHTGEAAIEAARLAKAAGQPVKVVWTREEEFTWAYFRPAALMELKAGVQRDGTLVAWEHHNFNSGNAALNTPYNVANQLIQYHPSRSPLRQGSYRGLASTANHFARESFTDELAHAVGIDPLQFRLKNLADRRLITVLESAAEKFGWDHAKSTPQRGCGLACGVDKGGYIATCAEVEIDVATSKVRIIRVVQAWESGAIVNPDGLRNQNIGAIVQGIGGALFEAIQFADGHILNPHFADYRLPRFKDTPEIEIVLIDRKDLPSAGAGETGLVGLAPAVGNAIFAATGTRLRNMPMAPGKAKTGTSDSHFSS